MTSTRAISATRNGYRHRASRKNPVPRNLPLLPSDLPEESRTTGEERRPGERPEGNRCARVAFFLFSFKKRRGARGKNKRISAAPSFRITSRILRAFELRRSRFVYACARILSTTNEYVLNCFFVLFFCFFIGKYEVRIVIDRSFTRVKDG